MLPNNPNTDLLEVDNNHLKKIERKIKRKAENKYRDITPDLFEIGRHYSEKELKDMFSPEYLEFLRHYSTESCRDALLRRSLKGIFEELERYVTDDNFTTLIHIVFSSESITSITPIDREIIEIKLDRLFTRAKKPFKVFREVGFDPYSYKVVRR